jgi:hypothetical protein
MKQPKRLTRAMKIKLSKKGFNPEEYRCIESTPRGFTVKKRDGSGWPVEFKT